MLVGDLLAGLKSRAHWLWAGAWFVFVCISYTILSDALLTGYSTRKSQIQTEIPLLGLLFGFLYASLRRGPFRPVLASLPFIGFYVCCDVFYAAFGKALRFVDFRLLPEVLTVFSAQERAFSAQERAFSALVALVPILLLICFIDFRRARTIFMLALVALVLTLPVTLPAAIPGFVDARGIRVRAWGDIINVVRNGRLSMLFYYESKRQHLLADLAERLENSTLPDRSDRVETSLRST